MKSKKPPSITGSRVLDITLQKEGSRAWRVFWGAVGNDAARRAAAKPAWDGLDPFLLPDDVFADDFDFLARAIYDEQKAHAEHTRRLKALVPTAAAPDAETLVPGPAGQTLTTDITLRDAQRLLDTPSTASTKPKKPPPSNFFEKKAEEAKMLAAVDNEPKQLVLPAVAEPERVAPTLWLRSAIFGVVERGSRSTVFEKPLPTPWVKGEMLFSGPELDQADLDVMLQVVHMASSQGVIEKRLVFSDKGVLQALGRSYSSGNREWLRATFSRLTSSKVTIREDGELRGREYQFLREQAWDNGRRAIIVTESAAQLFADQSYTVLQWKARLSLSTSLAKWLHGFLMSQTTTTNGVGLQIIKDLSGVPASRPMRLFKFDLKKALSEVVGLNDPHLGLISAEIVKGKDGAPKLMWSRRPNRRRALAKSADDD